MNARSQVRLLQGAVFVSGGVSLVLEQVFQKYLATLVGASTPASTVVLATYFLGLSLGAWLAPKGTRFAGLQLGLLELFVGGWSVLLALGFYGSYDLLASLLASASGGPIQLALGRWAVAALWILPPTMAMGAHLPTLGSLLRQRGLSTGEHLTRLYSLNLAGACSFTLLTPPLLFNNLGLQGTLLLAAGLGLALAATLLAAFAKGPSASAAPEPAASQGAPEAAAPSTSTPPAAGAAPEWPFALALVSGFAFFALEVIWGHLIGAVLGNSTYSFSMLLGVVLLSMSLGGRRVAAAAPNDLGQARSFLQGTLASLLLAMAVTLLFWPYAGKVLALSARAFGVQSFWFAEVLKLGVAYLLIKPVATAAGQLYPLTFHGFAAQGGPDGGHLGRLNALNAFGCITGALVAGFGLVPWLGSETSLRVIWAMFAVSWGVLALRSGAAVLKTEKATALAGIALVAVAWPWNKLELTGGYGVYFLRTTALDSQLVFWREDTASGLTTVIDADQPNELLRREKTRYLFTNGKFQADDNQQIPAQVAFALFPALHADVGPALVIGVGSAQTTATLWALGYKDLDACDIAPANLEAARRYFGHINRHVLDQPGVNVYEEDGRNFLLRTQRKYQVISMELTSVWFAGAADLYSREFYRIARQRLAPGGVFQQWFQLHHLEQREIVSMIATLAAEFPHVELWQGGPQLVALASEAPLQVREERWRNFREAPDLETERQLFDLLAGGGALENFTALRMLDEAGVAEAMRRVPHVLNSDRTKWLEFHSPLFAYDRRPLAEQNREFLRGVARDVAKAAPAPAQAQQSP